MFIKKLVVGLVAVASAAAAQALTIPMSSTVSLNGNLSQGQSQTVQVNVNNLLAGLSSSSINGGTLTVHGISAYSGFNLFNDESSYGFKETRQVDVWSCTGKDNKNCSWKTVNEHLHVKGVTAHNFDGIVDTMRVFAGSSYGNDMVGWTDGTTDFGAVIEEPNKTSNNSNGTRNAWGYQTRTHSSGFSGALEVSMNLDAAALADLATDGILNFIIDSRLGNFNLLDARLDFTAQEQDSPAQGTIPVPTSLLLTGLGLAALGGVRRRKA